MDLTMTVYDAIAARFQELFGEKFGLEVPLGRFTSSRLGGSADMFVVVETAEELQTAVEMAYTQNIPYLVLGGGSNILIADAGIRGLVLLNKARAVRFRHSGTGVVCTVESGMNFSLLARQCINKGLGGLEWAVGVPGTVGGAVFGNAGAHGSDMAANLLSATIWRPGQGVVILSNEEMQFGYRTSLVKEQKAANLPRAAVLSVELLLKPEPVEILTARADGFTARRKETQPGGATMGSMFKNPEHYYAGYLIEAAGLKGLTVGGATISEKHANFFICNEMATAEDARALIAEAWHAVRDQFGVELDLEVELVGDWQFEE